MEEQKQFDSAAIAAEREQRFQKRLLDVKNLLARYTTEADKGNFYERNRSAIEALAHGDTMSNVITGFRKLSKPDEAYDARVELLYYKDAEDKWTFSPRFHFKKEELLISPTLTLPTLAKGEYAVSIDECRQNKLATTINVEGERVTIELNEAELTELNTTKQLSRVIKSDDNSKYEYWVSAKLDSAGRNIDRLIVTQKEKVQLSDTDIQQLTQTGRLDKPIQVGEGINERKYFVAVDKELNSLAFSPSSVFKNLDKVRVVNLSQLDINNLLSGKQVTSTVMFGEKAGTQATVYLDPVKKNLKIDHIEAPQQQQGQKVAHAQKEKATMSNALKNATKAVAQKAPTLEQTQRQGMRV
jgi:hypothetical protein